MKKCKYCKKNLVRNYGETGFAFNKRINCGQKCAGYFKAGHFVKKIVYKTPKESLDAIDMLRE